MRADTTALDLDDTGLAPAVRAYEAEYDALRTECAEAKTENVQLSHVIDDLRAERNELKDENDLAYRTIFDLEMENGNLKDTIVKMTRMFVTGEVAYSAGEDEE